MPLPLPPADLHAFADDDRLPVMTGVLLAVSVSALMWAVIFALFFWRG